MIAATIFSLLVVSVSCFPQGSAPAAPKIDHATALRLHHQAVQSHNVDNPYWAVVDVEPKWTGPLAGGDVFWANPAARANYAPEPAPKPVVQEPVAAPVQAEVPVNVEPVPTAAVPVVDHATALRNHASALANHNTRHNDLFWAHAKPTVVVKPIEKPAPTGYTGPLAGGDVFWANPSARF